MSHCETAGPNLTRPKRASARGVRHRENVDSPHHSRPLAQFFLNERTESESETWSFSEDSVETSRAYNWSGNVRQLENVVERTVISTGHRLGLVGFER